MLSLTFIVTFFSIEYWMWYPLKACLFEEGPISDVLLLRDSNELVARAQDVSWFFCKYLPWYF